MKIISKFKDYYDYLQGVYGVDEKLILDRTDFFHDTCGTIDSIKTFYIGEYMVQGFCRNGKIFYGGDVEQFSNQKRDKAYYFGDSEVSKNEYWYIPNGKYNNLYCLKEPKFLGHKSKTWVEDCPILLGDNKNPILKDYNFDKVFKPEKIWIILSEWLGKRITKNEPIVPVGSDKVRILSAGFDLKTSFRHPKN